MEKRSAAYPSKSMSISSTSLERLYSFLPPPEPLEPAIQPPPGPGEPQIQQSIPVTSPPRNKPFVRTWPYTGNAPWVSFRFDTSSQGSVQEAVPVSPKTTDPIQSMYYLPDIFDGFEDVSAEPEGGDGETTPTQADFPPQQWRVQYHHGGNFFLATPAPAPVLNAANSTATDGFSVPLPMENMLPREKGRANIWPPEMLSPYPYSEWEGGAERENWEIGAPVGGQVGEVLEEAQLPIRCRGSGFEEREGTERWALGD